MCQTYLISSVEHVETEQLEVEVLPLHRMTVELGKRHKDVVIYTVLMSDRYDERQRRTRRTNDTVEETHSDDRQDRPERVPEQQVGVLEDAERHVSNELACGTLSRRTIDCSTRSRSCTTRGRRYR